MFYLFSIISLLCWSGSDLFSKMGTNQEDKHSHWKVVFAVGLIMGIHAVITLIGGCFINEETAPKWVSSLFYTDFQFIDFLKYFPIAFIYILAMVFGYIGLRYIELSVSSPICNSSGSLALLICCLVGWATLSTETIIGVCLITVGIIGLGFVEYYEDETIKMMRQENSSFKYRKSMLAFLIPIIYLVLDSLGTVGDQSLTELNLFEISDYSANTSFELTMTVFAIFGFIYVKIIKKQKFFTGNKYLYIGGACETIGQIFYMMVMFSEFDAGMALISAYCVLSVLWSRIFLKEKLSWKHYIMIILTITGIVLLGIFSEV